MSAVRQATAWFGLHRKREAFADFAPLFDAPVESTSTRTPDIVAGHQTNQDGSIDVWKYRQAIRDHNDGTITYDEMLAVTKARFQE